MFRAILKLSPRNYNRIQTSHDWIRKVGMQRRTRNTQHWKFIAFVVVTCKLVFPTHTMSSHLSHRPFSTFSPFSTSTTPWCKEICKDLEFKDRHLLNVTHTKKKSCESRQNSCKKERLFQSLTVETFWLRKEPFLKSKND